MVIVWAERPKRELQKAYRYISKNSELSAEKFRQDIIRHIQALLQFPEKHPLDKYKTHNDGTCARLKYIITVFHIVFLKTRSALYV